MLNMKDKIQSHWFILKMVETQKRQSERFVFHCCGVMIDQNRNKNISNLMDHKKQGMWKTITKTKIKRLRFTYFFSFSTINKFL